MLKSNQPDTRAAVELLFWAPPWGKFSRNPVGKPARRPARAALAVDFYCLAGLSGLARSAAGLLAGARPEPAGETTVEWAYALTSPTSEQAGPQRLLKLWREHWGIANRGHWAPATAFGEDDCPASSGVALPVLAALRNLVLDLLRWAGQGNIAAALRHYGWHPPAAVQLLGFPFPNN